MEIGLIWEPRRSRAFISHMIHWSEFKVFPKNSKITAKFSCIWHGMVEGWNPHKIVADIHLRFESCSCNDNEIFNLPTITAVRNEFWEWVKGELSMNKKRIFREKCVDITDLAQRFYIRLFGFIETIILFSENNSMCPRYFSSLTFPFCVIVHPFYSIDFLIPFE